MAACEFCSGTHYLCDEPGMGACVCCTPENMQKRDRTIAALSEPDPELERLRAHVGQLEAAASQREKTDDELSLVEVFDRLESTVALLGQRIAEGERAAAERLEKRREMAALLADYLVSLGLPAVPAGTISNPHLEALYGMVEPLADVEPEGEE